jgi:hypothetical protein
MGGAISPQIDHNFVKIKGGNWTVARFFVLSVAYTSGTHHPKITASSINHQYSIFQRFDQI